METLRQELQQRPQRMLFTNLFSVAYSASFLTPSRTINHGVALPTVSWGLHINHSLQSCLWAKLMKAFLQLRFLLPSYI